MCTLYGKIIEVDLYRGKYDALFALTPHQNERLDRFLSDGIVSYRELEDTPPSKLPRLIIEFVCKAHPEIRRNEQAVDMLISILQEISAYHPGHSYDTWISHYKGPDGILREIVRLILNDANVIGSLTSDISTWYKIIPTKNDLINECSKEDITSRINAVKQMVVFGHLTDQTTSTLLSHLLSYKFDSACQDLRYGTPSTADAIPIAIPVLFKDCCFFEITESYTEVNSLEACVSGHFPRLAMIIKGLCAIAGLDKKETKRRLGTLKGFCSEKQYENCGEFDEAKAMIRKVFYDLTYLIGEQERQRWITASEIK